MRTSTWNAFLLNIDSGRAAPRRYAFFSYADAVPWPLAVRTMIEHPYMLARRFSTLDHLTGGRIGWNVVTGYLNSAAKGIGLARQPEHDTRYEIAEEYMQIVYKLWEGSWEDGAVLRDRTQRVFARPEKVHRIRHDGRYFQIEATHLCDPSPQRTPLIYQAGASSRGRQFAATHAECVFINGPSKQVIAPIVADQRQHFP